MIPLFVRMLTAAGHTGVIVTLSAYDETGANTDPNSAFAGVACKQDGNIATDSGSGTSGTYTSVNYVNGDPNEWADPETATVGNDYHVRMNTTSGTLSTGTADSWLALTSDRVFEVTQTGAGTQSWTGVMEISKDGGSTVMESSSEFTLQATVT